MVGLKSYDWEWYDCNGFLPTVWWPGFEQFHGRPFSVKKRIPCIAGTPYWLVEVQLSNGKTEEHMLPPESIIGVNVGMYASETGFFTEEELDQDNTYSAEVPFDLWQEWCAILAKEEGRTIDPIDFFENEYTCDDTTGFFDFCEEKGYQFPVSSGLRHYDFDSEGNVV